MRAYMVVANFEQLAGPKPLITTSSVRMSHVIVFMIPADSEATGSGTHLAK